MLLLRPALSSSDAPVFSSPAPVLTGCVVLLVDVQLTLNVPMVCVAVSDFSISSIGTSLISAFLLGTCQSTLEPRSYLLEPRTGCTPGVCGAPCQIGYICLTGNMCMSK